LRVGCSAVSSFAEVRIVAERLELREFGPQDAVAVKALVAAGDRTSLLPGAPSQLPEVDAWLADGAHRHRREGGGVHLMMLERLRPRPSRPWRGGRWPGAGCSGYSCARSPVTCRRFG
jgi:hypothetical protein